MFQRKSYTLKEYINVAIQMHSTNVVLLTQTDLKVW